MTRAVAEKPARTAGRSTPADEGDVVVRGLERRYPGGAGVAGIDLTVPKGQMVSLLGASGCGKTTTLRCLAGIDTPSAGEVWIGGRHVWSSTAGINLPPERRNIGMVFQSYALWPHMTALENVMFPLKARKVGGREARERAQQMLELVGLGHLAERTPDRLSGGQQQRVALARAMVYRPNLLLFDEPLSNLDAELRETVRQDIRRTQQEMGITALYVTHDRTEAMALSDRVIVMAEGRLVQSGTPRELLTKPASPFVASLLGSANLVRGEVAAVARDGDAYAVTLATPSGAHFPGRCDASLTPGSAAVVAIRPTALRLDAPGSGPAGRVRDWYPTGPEFEYVVDIGGATVKVLSHDELAFDRGDEVSLRYDATAATCFGAAAE